MIEFRDGKIRHDDPVTRSAGRGRDLKNMPKVED